MAAALALKNVSKTVSVPGLVRKEKAKENKQLQLVKPKICFFSKYPLSVFLCTRQQGYHDIEDVGFNEYQREEATAQLFSTEFV